MFEDNLWDYDAFYAHSYCWQIPTDFGCEYVAFKSIKWTETAYSPVIVWDVWLSEFAISTLKQIQRWFY